VAEALEWSFDPAVPLPPDGLAAPGGRIAGRYRVVGELGRGAVGVVLRARDEELRRDVALKVIVRESPRTLVRAVREAELTAGLTHAGIVRVHDAGVEGATAWIAYERIEGARPLGAAWAAEPAGRLAQVRGVVAAVAFAHARGVVHRDLKPANVLVGRDGRPRVVDFGLGRALGESARLTRTGEVVGTPFYLPPEVLAGAADVDPRRTDVWALGILLYEALAGRHPFGGAASPDDLGRRQGEPLPPLPAAAGEAERRAGAACRAALAFGPAARPPEAGALLALLDRDPPARRPRRLAAATAGIGGLALLAGVLAASTPDGAGSGHARGGPLPAGPAGWPEVWSLDGGAPPRIEAPALWADAAGRRPRPLGAGPAPPPAAFPDAEVEAIGGGRTRVRYVDLAAALRPAAVDDAAALRLPAPWRPDAAAAGPRAARLGAPGGAGAVVHRLGDGRWAEGAVEVRAERTGGADGGAWALRLGDVDGSASLTVAGPSGAVAVRPGSGAAPARRPGAWPGRVRFAPGAGPGQRVVLDGAAAEDLDAALAPGPPAGPLRIRLVEVDLVLRDLAVIGRVLRPDRAARAVVPAPVGTEVSAALAFTREARGLGGPFLGLAPSEGPPLRLELDGERLILRRGGERLAEAPLAAGPGGGAPPSGPPRAGWLALERRGDVAVGAAELADGRRGRLEAALPEPLGAGLRVTYGSTAPELEVRAACVHAGSDDPARRAFDAGGGGVRRVIDAGVDDRGDDAEGTGAWRRGALLLGAASDVRRAPAPVWGPDDAGRRRLAARAAVLLEDAEGRLERPLRLDAAARAVWARALAGDAAGARVAAERLIALEGRSAARARVAALRRGEDEEPVLLARLAAGTTPRAAPDVRLAAAEAAATLGGAPVTELVTAQARALLELARAAKPLRRAELLEDALARLRRPDAPASGERLVAEGEVLLALGRPEEAAARWDRYLERRAGDWRGWLQRARCRSRLDRPAAALEDAIVALSLAPLQAPARRTAGELAERCAGRPDARGLAAMALILLADRAPESEARRLRTRAEELAIAPGPSSARARLAGRYVLERLGHGGIPAPDPRIPLSALGLARDGDAGAVALLSAARSEDPLVAAVIRLDPKLADLRR